ncbi:hypothetical protein Tco_1189887, partial [Tanacetum coccineum]
MDQDSAHMVATSKVPMLKPGEFEIWRMRIEQYIQMIDYALWVVIENGETLPKTTTVEGVETLKFNSIKDAKKLLEAVEKRFGFKIMNKADLDTMSMDDLYNNLNVYEPEVKGVSSSSSSTQNMAFVSSLNNNTSSTNEAVNTAHGNTGRKLTINGNKNIGFDKSKLECYNCHKRGHFTPRNQDNKNKESSRRSVLVETSTSTALVSCYSLG